MFDKDAFHHWDGQNLEKDVMPGLVRRNMLYTYRHDGFWKSMDTYKDALELTTLCERATREGGRPPWMPCVASRSS